MLWIGLHLPRLSLEAFAAGLPKAEREAPSALLEAHLVRAANTSAQALGIRAGMKRATALALAPRLLLGQADADRDRAALLAVAHAALAFTPSVCEGESGDVVLLEVAASLRYFGGLRALLRRLVAALEPLGHRVHLACAPTAAGAALLAQGAASEPCAQGNGFSGPAAPRSPPEAGRWRPDAGRSKQGGARSQRGFDRAGLQARLEAVPVALLGAAREQGEAAFRAMGLATLGELRRLPRAGLARRFGEALLDELDRAFGERPDPRSWLSAPDVFEGRLELHARTEQAEPLLQAAQVLLARLVAWCAARQAQVRRFTLVLAHESRQRMPAGEPTRLEVALAEPSCDARHWLGLLGERLERTRLAAPALELALHCADIERRAPPNAELFPSRRSEREGLARLLERLEARLGEAQVQRLVRVQDHRPERSSRAQPARAPLPSRRPDGPKVQSLPFGPRPVWLLQEPQALAERDQQPLLGGRRLEFLCGPERIEAGWWEAQGLAERDYFIARQADGSLVWVFRARLSRQLDGEPGPGWYLHGRFG